MQSPLTGKTRSHAVLTHEENVTTASRRSVAHSGQAGIKKSARAKRLPRSRANELRLPASITPEPDESFVGVLLRATARSGLLEPGWLTWRLRMVARPYGQSNADEVLCGPLRLDPGELRRRQHLPIPGAGRFGQRAFRGIQLHSRFLDHGRKLCPPCARETGWLHVIWDIVPLTCCPTHGVRLLSRCTGCGGVLSWNRRGPTICRCGFDLSTVPMDTAPACTQSMMSLIAQKAGFDCIAPSVGLVPSEIDQLSLGELLHLIWFIGCAVAAPEGARQFSRQRHDAEIVGQMVDVASAILLQWPTAFYDFLDIMRTKLSDVANPTRLGEWKGFYSDACRILSARAFDFVRREFAFHLRATSNAYVAGRSAAKALRLPPSVLKEMVRTGQISGSIFAKRDREGVVVRRDSLAAYQDRKGEWITLTKLIKRLGLSSSSVHILTEAGVLKLAHEPERGKYRPAWRFVRNIADEFTTRCAAAIDHKCPRLDAAAHPVSLSKAAQIFRPAEIWLPKIIQLLMDGKLSARWPAEAPRVLGKVLLDWYQVRRLAADRRSETRDARTIHELSAAIGLHEAHLYDLCKVGLLVAHPSEKSTRGELLVTVEAWEEFSARYIAASELANRLKTHAKAVVRLLRELKIEPVTGPATDGRGKYYFHRSEVREFLSMRQNDSSRRMSVGPASRRLKACNVTPGATHASAIHQYKPLNQ